MAVADSTTIDAIGLCKDTGSVILTILDALPWDQAHLKLLEEKLNAYLGFIESGEIYSVYPGAKGRRIRISLMSRFRPNTDAESFIAHARAVVETYGAELVQISSGAGYADDAA
ncbi:hypothetical protein PEP31012_03579 [Pandoraea eparura]|uniref:Uncharacterized protein n=1 Tax=Pandoraea eparura TaxID=2508291 RepID=A0A5E4WXG8_9BURK|nr:DUF6572 domain-containing protein [Pandoraea eparura]VVE29231.1 hypothetical protein PEP31012_03579 [Pandoraea eparura]